MKARLLPTIALLALAASILAPSRLNANVYIYDFNYVISGSPPAGSGPWLQARFEDVSSGVVRFTLSALGLTGSENVIKSYFNFNPSYNPTSLNVAWDQSIGSFDLPVIALGENAFKADGDGYFDMRLEFNNDGGGGMDQFTTGESLVYLITSSDPLAPALQAADFNYMSVMGGGAGVYYTAAHIQRISAGEVSGWVGAPAAVPEPSLTALLGLGGLFLLRRKTGC